MFLLFHNKSILLLLNFNETNCPLWSSQFPSYKNSLNQRAHHDAMQLNHIQLNQFSRRSISEYHIRISLSTNITLFTNQILLHTKPSLVIPDNCTITPYLAASAHCKVPDNSLDKQALSNQLASRLDKLFVSLDILHILHSAHNMKVNNS